MITVLGATGAVGREIARWLLATGEEVRVVGRDRKALAALGRLGASVFAGDFDDVAALSNAFDGAQSVYSMLPFDPAASDIRNHQNRIGNAIMEALRSTGVLHIVALSGLGAELSNGTGLVSNLHAQEQRLRTLNANILFLRPGHFFETITASVNRIAKLGYHADAVAPNVPIAMIAMRDVAIAAAKALRERDWVGFRVRELLGPRDLSYRRATQILGVAIGQPNLQYVRLRDSDMVDSLVRAGFSADAATQYVARSRALSEGVISTREGRSDKNTTLTSFEEAVADLVAMRGR